MGPDSAFRGSAPAFDTEAVLPQSHTGVSPLQALEGAKNQEAHAHLATVNFLCFTLYSKAQLVPWQ